VIRPGVRGGRRWTETRGSISARGLVPFLDTLFNLLFALLAIHAAQRAAGSSAQLELRLPSVERGPTERALGPAELVLLVDARGAIRVPGVEPPLRAAPELDRALTALVGDKVPEEVPIEICADALCPQGVVVELLQHLRLLGFADVRLQALAREGSSGLFGDAR